MIYLQQWELVSYIATTVGAALTVLGLVVVIIQLQRQQMQSRLDALDALYSQLDTHEARLARDRIYNADAYNLRYKYLHETPTADTGSLRQDVEETLATFGNCLGF